MGKRKILPDVSEVSIGNEARLAQPAFPLAVLALEQVARALFAAEDLPGTSDFEALGDGFPCLCFSRDSWHGTGKLGIPAPLARQKCAFCAARQGDWQEIEQALMGADFSILDRQAR
jgi:hypothetical protein